MTYGATNGGRRFSYMFWPISCGKLCRKEPILLVAGASSRQRYCGQDGIGILYLKEVSTFLR